MRQLFSLPVLATTALLALAAVHCSDSTDPDKTVDNQQPTSGASSITGSSGPQGDAGTVNAAGSDSSAGSASGGSSMNLGGSAGMANLSMGGSAMTDAGVAGSSFADAGIEEVDSDQSEEPEEDPVEPNPSGPLVALTFDDGPNPNQTPDVLDRLEQYGVPASFFLIGQNINAGAQAVLDRAANLGCEFENHSNGFDGMGNFSAQQVQQSVNTTTQLIQQFTSQTPEFFRAPNLQTSQVMFDNIDLPFARGLLGNDFPGGNPQVQAIANAIVNNVQDGTIILLHDSQPGLNPHPTPAALDIIIPTLQQRGFQFVTLRQLFEFRGVNPNSQANIQWDVVPPQN